MVNTYIVPLPNDVVSSGLVPNPRFELIHWGHAFAFGLVVQTPCLG